MVVPTNDSWGRIERLLYQCQYATSRYNLKVFVCNYGKSERTKVAVENFTLDHRINIVYKKYGNIKNYPIARIQKDFFEKGREFDYIWVISDYMCPNFPKIFEILAEAKEKDIPCVLANTVISNLRDSLEDKVEKSSPHLLEKYKEEIIPLGGLVIKGQLAYESSNYITDEQRLPFWQFSTMAELFVRKTFPVLVPSENLFYYNDMPSYLYLDDVQTNTFDLWTNGWYQAITALPMEYNGMKKKFLLVDDELYTPFYLMNFVRWKAQGNYNRKMYRQIKDKIPLITSKSSWKMSLIANMPRYFCRWIIRNQESRTMHKALEVYRICFTKSEM